MTPTNKTLWPIGKLHNWEKNPRSIHKDDFERLKRQIQKFGQYKPLLATEDGTVLGGNMRLRAFKDLGITEVWVSIVDAPDEKTKLEYALSDNDRAGSYDEEVLAELVTNTPEIDLTDYKVDLGEPVDLSDLLARFSSNDEHDVDPSTSKGLFEKFIVPPFSILDARQGYWQERKRAWLALGIRSELGRDKGVITDSLAISVPGYYDQKYRVEKTLGRKLSTKEFEENYLDAGKYAGGFTSVFDPVLCELIYRWFCPSGGTVLDPFAGGSVRGIVAAWLGRQYVGVELRSEQVVANRAQWPDIEIQAKGIPEIQANINSAPVWIEGDSTQIDTLASDVQADLIFSCPPYADLEVYSDDPRDLSTADYPEFLEMYRTIITKSCAKLKDNRFACFVVGDVRDTKGFYRNFVSDTISAFQDSGVSLYNEAIIVTTVGSLPVRSGKTFQSSRKLGKTHQNVLIFYKGDPKKIKDIYGDVEVTVPQDASANDSTNGY